MLPVVIECRDLGVTMTSDLSMSNHISAIVAKAHQCAMLFCVVLYHGTVTYWLKLLWFMSGLFWNIIL